MESAQPVPVVCRLVNDTGPKTDQLSKKDSIEYQSSANYGVEVVMLYDATSLNRLLSQVSAACTVFDSGVDNQTATVVLSTPAVNKTSCSVCGVTFMTHSEQMKALSSNYHALVSCGPHGYFKVALKCQGYELPKDDAEDSSGSTGSETSVSDTDNSVNGDEMVNEIPRTHCADNQRVVFSNGAGKLLSINRCLVADVSKEHPPNDVELCQKLKQLSSNTLWIVMMASGGHFAGAVFDGPEVIRHKTFHRYVVRAKRGTAQSQRDGKGGNAPKSAGASLRRYNEAAFTEEIHELLSSWVDEISRCSRIFLRAPGHNRLLFFGGKNCILTKTDPRVCAISVMTKRPTFREVKRVQRILATVTVADEETATELLDQSKEIPYVNQCSLSSFALDSSGQTVHSLGSSEANSAQANDSSRSSHKDVSLPALDSSSPSQAAASNHLPNDVTPALHISREGTSVSKKTSKKLLSNSTEVQTADSVSIVDKSFDDNYDRLYTACKTGSLDEACSVLHSLRESCSESALEKSLNRQTGPASVTLLHVSSKAGHVPVVRLLLEHGADPAVRDVHNNPPYVCATKEVKCEYRRFMADNMGLHDYVRAQIPGPLTDEMENERKIKEAAKKKAKRNAKRDKEKELKAAELKAKEEAENKRLEELKKQQFLALSDREKRALAAEQRLKLQQTTLTISGVRCWQCGVDMAGKVPFEYFDYKFCSTSCLKTHRTMTAQ